MKLAKRLYSASLMRTLKMYAEVAERKNESSIHGTVKKKEKFMRALPLHLRLHNVWP